MAFTFKLQPKDGTPADPPTLHTAVPNWSPGDTIPLGRDRRFVSSGYGLVGIRTKSRPWWSCPSESFLPLRNRGRR
jgi:hypothetical protein